jgi:hypothetical protein
MTETLNKIVVDCSTGEQTIVPLTEAELIQRELDAAACAEQKAIEDAQAIAKAEARESAEAKLAELGLTAAEIAALKG